MIPASGTERNRLFATITGLTLGGLAYFLTLLDYRPSLTRTTLQSGLFSTFYDQAKVIVPEEPERSSRRLALAVATQTTLARALGLLGISAPESM